MSRSGPGRKKTNTHVSISRARNPNSSFIGVLFPRQPVPDSTRPPDGPFLGPEPGSHHGGVADPARELVGATPGGRDDGDAATHVEGNRAYCAFW